MSRVLVTGGSSVVGSYLLRRLTAAGHNVTVLSRQARNVTALVADWRQVDIAGGSPWRELPSVDVVIHLAPLPLLSRFLVDAPAALRQVIAIGTTSVYTKAASASPKDQALVAEQRAAEQSLADFCRGRNIGFVLFRPTLVYDGLRDKNVARIASMIRRCGFFPVAAPGKGLRQPLHADDLAAACVVALDIGVSAAYELSGGEVLSYRAMVERIFRSLGRRPRVLPVPLIFYRAAIAAARMLPAYRGLTPEVADRMNKDMVFDSAAARRDLGFAPRPFMPQVKE